MVTFDIAMGDLFNVRINDSYKIHFSCWTSICASVPLQVLLHVHTVNTSQSISMYQQQLLDNYISRT